MRIRHALKIDDYTHVKQFTCGLFVPYISQWVADRKLKIITSVFEGAEDSGLDLELNNRILMKNLAIRQQLYFALITILTSAHKDSKEYKQACKDYKKYISFTVEYEFPQGIDNLKAKISQFDLKIEMMKPKQKEDGSKKETFFSAVAFVEEALSIRPHIDRNMRLSEFKKYYNRAVEVMKKQQADANNR